MEKGVEYIVSLSFKWCAEPQTWAHDLERATYSHTGPSPHQEDLSKPWLANPCYNFCKGKSQASQDEGITEYSTFCL